MTDSEPFYAPFRKPRPPRQPKPGELLFEFVRDSDHVRFRCELRNQGAYGFDAQFYREVEFLISRRFDTRALAVQWAELEREYFEKGGA